MRGRALLVLIGLGAGLIAANSARADTTWNTTVCPIASCPTDSSPVPVGNTLTFVSGGQSTTVAAYNVTATATKTETAVNLTSDMLGLYSGNGLGVGTQAPPRHAVDNATVVVNNVNRAHSDLVLFQLPTNYKLVSLALNSFGSSYPNDVTIIVGSAAAAAAAGVSGLSSFSSLSISTLLTDGFQQLSYQGLGTKNETSDTFGNTNTSGGTVTEALTSPVAARYVLVLAALAPTSTDYFKVAAITGRLSTSVPEPATFTLFIVGAFGMYMLRRRRADRGTFAT